MRQAAKALAHLDVRGFDCSIIQPLPGLDFRQQLPDVRAFGFHDNRCLCIVQRLDQVPKPQVGPCAAEERFGVVRLLLEDEFACGHGGFEVAILERTQSSVEQAHLLQFCHLRFSRLRAAIVPVVVHVAQQLVHSLEVKGSEADPASHVERNSRILTGRIELDLLPVSAGLLAGPLHVGAHSEVEDQPSTATDTQAGFLARGGNGARHLGFLALSHASDSAL
mmetsp:Transcript_24082/g.56069  ORF Transcript_24082/g.56069 Transcript_24082/m.56069 type:complete len:222 (-) Transcript_24082:416-1081(-)